MLKSAKPEHMAFFHYLNLQQSGNSVHVINAFMCFIGQFRKGNLEFWP